MLKGAYNMFKKYEVVLLASAQISETFVKQAFASLIFRSQYTHENDPETRLLVHLANVLWTVFGLYPQNWSIQQLS